jgi:hypothetical protein
MATMLETKKRGSNRGRKQLHSEECHNLFPSADIIGDQIKKRAWDGQDMQQGR